MTTTVVNPYAPPVERGEERTLDSVKVEVLEEILGLPETPCEVAHVFSTCTHVVRWKTPPQPCGCYGSLNACQGAYDHLANQHPFNMARCNLCGFEMDVRSWLKGWVRI